MTIQFTCPSCGKGLRSPENLAGQSARCPQCGLVVSVPSPSSPPSPATPPSVPDPVIAPSSAEVPIPGFDPGGQSPADDWLDGAAEMPPMPPPVVSQPPDATRSATSDNVLLDFVLFRRMIAPLIIQIIFWLNTSLGLVFGVLTLITGFGMLFSDDVPALVAFIQILTGFAILIISPLIARIVAEMLILFFRMNETLTDIRNRLESMSTS